MKGLGKKALPAALPLLLQSPSLHSFPCTQLALVNRDVTTPVVHERDQKKAFDNGKREIQHPVC
jgi:hypothetical protein